METVESIQINKVISAGFDGETVDIETQNQSISGSDYVQISLEEFDKIVKYINSERSKYE